jgi:hypothetical protein
MPPSVAAAGFAGLHLATGTPSRVLRGVRPARQPVPEGCSRGAGGGAEECKNISVYDAEDGILISPREVGAMDALDRIGKALQKQGIILEKLIDTGRESRGRMVEQE